MAQMMSRERRENVGDAEVYDVKLTDGETIRIIVSNAQRAVMGSDEAFSHNLSRTLAGRNTTSPSRSSRSFV